MSDNKAPNFVDLDENIHGTWLGKKAQGNEPQLVYPEYVPFNSFKKCSYEKPVNIHHIFPFEPVLRGVKGQEPKTVYIYRGLPGGFLDAVLGKVLRENDELRKRNKMLELQVSSERQKSQTAMGGTEEAVQRAVSIAKTARSGSPNDEINVFDAQRRKDFEEFG